MDKIGKKSPFLTGKHKFPSLRDWDVKTATQELQKVHDLMGLEHGLTTGVNRLYRTDEGPLLMCFDPDTCPLYKAEEYLNHYRGCIRIYTGAAQTLERRIAEANVGTSAKNNANSAEPKTTKDKTETNLMPDTKDNKSSNNEKGVEVAKTEEAETESEESEVKTEETESEEGETETEDSTEHEKEKKEILM